MIKSGPLTYKALENLTALDSVIVAPSDILDRLENYDGTASVQAEWVDSDAGNKMVARQAQNVNTSQQFAMTLTAVNPNNTGDYADNTISSRSVNGYTVHMVIKASATSGDWEFLLASGANAATSNVKKALTVAAANKWEHVSFTVAGMAADNGTFTDTACIHAGFRCADDTGGPTLSVAMIWFTKAGTTYNGLLKTLVGSGGSTTEGTYGTNTVGIVPAAITSGAEGILVPSGPIVGGFSNLVPGFTYFLDQTSGTISAFNQNAGMLDVISGYYIQVGVAISDTELMLRYNNNAWKT